MTGPVAPASAGFTPPADRFRSQIPEEGKP
jgi:hypothetical protein